MKETENCLWGTITASKKIAPNVYWIEAEEYDKQFNIETRSCREGIAIECKTAKSVLPSKALVFAAEADGYLYYDRETTMHIVLFELLTVHYITDYQTIREFDIDELEIEGKLFLPEYFGTFEFNGIPMRGSTWLMNALANGIWAIKTVHQLEIFIHKIVAETELSDIAIELGIKKGDYLCYEETTCAIVLYELSEVHKNIENTLGSRAEIMGIIKSNFPAYAAAMQI